MCDLPGCGHNSYAQKPLKGSDYGGMFLGCWKKPPKTVRIIPECLNGLVCPQTGCVIFPQKCIIPFLPSELSQDQKSESFRPVCPRSWGVGGGSWFPFHLL